MESDFDFKAEQRKDEQLEIFQDEIIKVGKVVQERFKILMSENKMTHNDFFKYIEYEQYTSNASKILNNPSKLAKNVVLLKRVSEKFNVSINWLIGNLSLDVRHDNVENINDYTGLTEESIEKIHNIKYGNFKYHEYIKDLTKKNYDYDYELYIRMLNELICNEDFYMLLEDLRLLFQNTRIKNLNLNRSYGISNDGSHVMLSSNSAMDFLLQKTSDDFKKIIKKINNIQE